jgi:hypothetical protein
MASSKGLKKRRCVGVMRREGRQHVNVTAGHIVTVAVLGHSSM